MKLKFKLFPKLFLTIFLAIFATIILFAFIFRFFISSYLNSYYSNQFTKINNSVHESLKSKAVADLLSEDYFSSLERSNDISITVTDRQGVLHYPVFKTNATITPYTLNPEDNMVSFNMDTFSGESVGGYTFQTPANVLDNNSLSQTYEVQNGNQIYYISLDYKIQFNAKQISNLFLSIIPYLLIFGMFTSALIAYIYAKSHVNKIKRLNGIMTQMENQEYSLLPHPVCGDELAELENHIDALYNKLSNEMKVIQKFEKDREIFMKGSIHELKTPMMGISLQLEGLMNSNLDEQQAQSVIDSYQKIGLMNQLVSEVLSISKLETILEIQEVELSPILEELKENYEYLLNDKQMQLMITCDDTPLQMNARDFTKVCSNLISNAIKYGDEQSTIYITWNNQQFLIKNSYSSQLEIKEDLLSPFVSLDETQDSNGLGLYIVSILLHKYNLDFSYELTNNQFVFQFKQLSTK